MSVTQVAGPQGMELAAMELAAMEHAADLGRNGPACDPNPQVGAVVMDRFGGLVGQGYHRGAGTDHAEVVALRQAGKRARGSTVVVTLEPCSHVGRRPACTHALISAGVARVVFAVADPNPAASGGADRLRSAGIEVIGPFCHDKAEALTARWSAAVSRGRPWVTLKLALSLDGRVAAADGSSRWITSEEARADAHRLRAAHGAVAVGTGTALSDNPRLTVRHGQSRSGRPPLRVVIGKRKLPSGLHLSDQDEAATVHIWTRSPHRALEELFPRGVRAVLLEGGPTMASAWIRAEVVDEIIVYLAPVLLGSGLAAVEGIGVASIWQAWRGHMVEATSLGPDIRLRIRPRATAAAPATRPETSREEPG